MSILRYRIFRKWRDYFRGVRRDVPVVVDDDTVVPDPPAPGEDPGDVGTFLISHAGTRIPEQYVTDRSDEFLIKPDSGEGGDRGLCILLPWKFIDWVERAEIITAEHDFPLQNTTRDYAVPNSGPYPNGARVHLRNTRSGRDIGLGTLRIRTFDGAWLAWYGDFSKRSTDWALYPEGPAPLAETVLGIGNAHAEEINDVFYEDHTFQIPESWQIFQVTLFTYPLDGSTMLGRDCGVHQDEPVMTYAVPDVSWGHEKLIVQCSSCFAHVCYELAFDPNIPFTGSHGHMVIYTPIAEFPKHTHDPDDFTRMAPGKWVRI